jgi:CRISPR/Cas system CMR subunit Cmr6 (Cas7 group RAMP superfamily)
MTSSYVFESLSYMLVYIVQIEFHISIRHTLKLPYIKGSNLLGAAIRYFLQVTM